MVSYQVAREALKDLLSRPLQSFHQVLYHQTEDEKNAQLTYMCLAKHELVLCSVESLNVFKSKGAHSGGGAAGAADVPPAPSFDPILIEYKTVARITVDAENEAMFSMELKDKTRKFFSSCYRKDIVGALQVLINTSSIISTNNLVSVKVAFTNVDNSDPSKAFRHPAVKMFGDAPPEIVKGKTVFYRRGYMFLLPRGVVDRYELLDNRPCSTYIFRDADQKAGAKGATNVKPSEAMHLVARFLPPKPIPTDRPQSELEFALWTESIAYAVAEQEFQTHMGPEFQDVTGYKDSYFVPQRGMYRKKMNVVGDQARWTCFRVHIYTKVVAASLVVCACCVWFSSVLTLHFPVPDSTARLA